MNIFYKRPLCLILCVTLGGFVIFSRGTQNQRYALFAAVFLILLYSGIRNFLYKRSSAILNLVALLLLVSSLLSYLYFDKSFEIADKYDGAVDIEGKIIEFDASSSYTTRLAVETSEINKDKCCRKIILRVSKEDAAYLYLGANIRFSGVLERIESTDDFDSRTYYYSEGISASVEEYSSLKLLPSTGPTLAERLAILRENISRQAMLSMGADAGSLFAALFMGERAYLSPRLALDFGRIGISHILALSGMHLAILSLGITKLLSLLGIEKKKRSIILGAFIFFYMALTGFSPSVVRAGVMLIISHTLFLLASARDLLTNLAISVFIICLVTPYAIFDISLWLSALATFGIVSMSDFFADLKAKKNLAVNDENNDTLFYDEPKKKKLEREKKEKNPVKMFGSKLSASLCASFFAISATMALTIDLSGKLSLLGAVSTFIFSFLIEIFIYLGLLMLGIGMIFPNLGKAVMTPLYFLINESADKFSRFRFALLSADGPVLKIMIGVFTLLFFAFIVFKIKYAKAALCVLAASFIFVNCAAAAVTHTRLGDDVIYSSDERQDVLVLKSDGKAAVLDIAVYNEASAFKTLDLLDQENIFTLDIYAVSHYSFGLDDAVETVLKYVKVYELLIPVPINDDETAIYSAVTRITERYGSKIRLYSQNEDIKLGSFIFAERYRVEYGEGVMKCAFEITAENQRIAYLGSGMMHYLTRELSCDIISRSDTVIFGKHGKSYSPSYVINDVFPNVKVFIFSGEKISLSETAENLYKKKGTEVVNNPGNRGILN